MKFRLKRWKQLLLAGLSVAIVSAAVVWILWSLSGPASSSLPPPGPHKAGDVWIADLGGKTTMAMIWCPPGKFLMGSPATDKNRFSDETQHEVTLTQGFWLGQAEATQEQWQAVMGSNPSGFPKKVVVKKKFLRWEVPVWRSDFLVSRWRLPVEQVSWEDCQEFCKKAGPGFRLPTEGEWEYACRAGSCGSYAGSGILDEMGWYKANSNMKTHEVAKKIPNAWGLYDMHGNVSEWCQDCLDDYPTESVIDPKGPDYNGVAIFRGGSWNGGYRGCRSSCRSCLPCLHKGEDIGFRMVFMPNN